MTTLSGSSIRSSIHSLIRSSVRSSIHSLIRSSVRSSIHSLIRSSVRSLICFYCANSQISYMHASTAQLRSCVLGRQGEPRAGIQVTSYATTRMGVAKVAFTITQL